MRRFMASALIASTLCGPAGAGGYVAPILDIPPPLPAPAAAPAVSNPWVPYAAAGLLLLILVAGHDGGSGHHHTDHPTDPQFPPNPDTPDKPDTPDEPDSDTPEPAPVPLPGAMGLLLASLGIAGAAKAGKRRRRND